MSTDDENNISSSDDENGYQPFKRLQHDINKNIRKIENKRKKVLTKYNKHTTKFKIQYDKKWLKIKHCLHFIKLAGFTSFNDNNKIKLNWTALKEYIVKHNKEIQVLFDLHNCNIEEDDDIEDAYVRKSITNYINAKLENMLGLKIEKSTSHSSKYIIKKLA